MHQKSLPDSSVRSDMKILYCVNCYEDELYYRHNYYTNELSKIDGCDVYILTSDKTLPYKYKQMQTLRSGVEKKGRIILIRSNSIHFKSGVVYFPYRHIIDRIKPDIVHVFDAKHFVTYKIADYCMRKNIPVVYEQEQRISGVSTLGKMQSLFFSDRWIKRMIMGAKLLRAATPGAKRYLEKLAGRAGCTKIYLTTLGYDSGKFYFKESLRRECRNQCGYNEDDIVFGVTGKFDESKKIEVVICAFLKAATSRSNMRLLIVGPAGDRNKMHIKRLIKDRNEIMYLDDLLAIDELNKFYCSMDFGVWTSPTISFFEAMGTGLSIIVPYGSATSHLKSNKITFYGDKDSIEWETTIIKDSKKVKVLLCDIFTNISRDGSREAEQQYDVANIVRVLYQQYTQVIIENNGH